MGSVRHRQRLRRHALDLFTPSWMDDDAAKLDLCAAAAVRFSHECAREHLSEQRGVGAGVFYGQFGEVIDPPTLSKAASICSRNAALVLFFDPFGRPGPGFPDPIASVTLSAITALS